MKETCNNALSDLELLRNISSNENQVLKQFNFKVNVLFFLILSVYKLLTALPQKQPTAL